MDIDIEQVDIAIEEVDIGIEQENFLDVNETQDELKNDFFCIAKRFRLLAPEEVIELAQKISEGDKEAFDLLVNSNLRLVSWVVNKKFKNSKMDPEDLCQARTIGLMKAVEKFDYRKGYKFSPYARMCIIRTISREIYTLEKAIRAPEYMIENKNSMIKVSEQLLLELGREPKIDEIANKMGVTVDTMTQILELPQEPISLQTPAGEEDSYIEYFTPDKNAQVPADAAVFALLKEDLANLLSATLTPREVRVIQLRFGLDDGVEWSRNEAGKKLQLSRETIRQAELRAIEKLKLSGINEILKHCIY